MTPSPLATHSASRSEIRERLAAERSGLAYLLYRDGGGHQRIVQLVGERVTIGRRPSNDVPLSWDLAVSRTHAELVRLRDAWVLADELMSANGSWVNEELVDGRRELIDGDRLRFGDTVIAFRDARRT